MAQKIQTLFIDDIDGGEAEGTVRFGLDGTDYEIDLSAKNAAALRKALAKYIDSGRRTSERFPPAGPEWAPDERRRCRFHRGPRMGQVAGHRGQGPRPGASRPSQQVQGSDRSVSQARRRSKE